MAGEGGAGPPAGAVVPPGEEISLGMGGLRHVQPLYPQRQRLLYPHSGRRASASRRRVHRRTHAGRLPRRGTAARRAPSKRTGAVVPKPASRRAPSKRCATRDPASGPVPGRPSHWGPAAQQGPSASWRTAPGRPYRFSPAPAGPVSPGPCGYRGPAAAGAAVLFVPGGRGRGAAGGSGPAVDSIAK